MSDAQALAASAAACVAVILLAGWREHRRRHRHHADAVGVVDWASVQFGALAVLAVIGWVALRR